ncbi:MAG TPA: hypothetical protein VM182_04350 [Terriglobia bacterium]|nr:hypothetical protein [Terriglobia bacterium]
MALGEQEKWAEDAAATIYELELPSFEEWRALAVSVIIEAADEEMRRLRAENEALRANCAEIMRRYKDVAIVNHSKSHSDQFDFVTCPAQTCREYREMEKDTPGQALLDRLKALERVRELPGKWRSSADGPVPTDRSIGYETCADELDEALAACQVIGQPLKRGQP